MNNQSKTGIFAEKKRTGFLSKKAHRIPVAKRSKTA